MTYLLAENGRWPRSKQTKHIKARRGEAKQKEQKQRKRRHFDSKNLIRTICRNDTKASAEAKTSKPIRAKAIKEECPEEKVSRETERTSLARIPRQNL